MNEWKLFFYDYFLKMHFSIHKDHYCLVNHASQTREDEIFVLQGDWNTPTLSEQVLEKKSLPKNNTVFFLLSLSPKGQFIAEEFFISSNTPKINFCSSLLEVD